MKEEEGEVGEGGEGEEEEGEEGEWVPILCQWALI